MENNKVFVIDAHAHPPRKGVKGIMGIPETPYNYPKSIEEVQAGFELDLADLVSTMDKVRTDMKCLIANVYDVERFFHYGEFNKETGITSLSSVEWIKKAVKANPERFFACACLNPLEPSSISVLEDLACNFNFKGLKIHQAHYQLEANDRRAYPIYEKCVELGVPVMFHTGFSPVRDIDRYIPTMPHNIDELAHDMPELKIIMCHVGGNWYQDGVMITLRNPNVYVDIAGIVELCDIMVYPVIEPKLFLKRIIEIIGSERVMYGTDNNDVFNLGYMETVDITEKELKDVMGKTAKTLFNV